MEPLLLVFQVHRGPLPDSRGLHGGDRAPKDHVPSAGPGKAKGVGLGFRALGPLRVWEAVALKTGSPVTPSGYACVLIGSYKTPKT